MLAGRVGVTQYTLSVEQQERVLRSSAATRTTIIGGVDWDIIVLYMWTVGRAEVSVRATII